MVSLPRWLVSTPIQLSRGGRTYKQEKGKYIDQIPRILWNQTKYTQVVVTPTEARPIQTGRGGQILLELA